MNLDEKRLVKLRQYEVDNYKNLKIVKKGNKYIEIPESDRNW